MSRTLALMARIRGLAVAEARRDLADHLRREGLAEAAADAAVARLLLERSVATDMQANDAAVEAFAAWLPHGTKTLADSSDGLTRAQAATAQARARLTVARASDAALEALIAAKKAEAEAERLKQEQLVLDEIGVRRSR